MIEGMCFVYALSHNGNIFYIGRAKDLAARYKSHLRGTECLRVHSYIKELLASGSYPIMKAVAYLPIKDAVKKEIELTHLLTMAGLALLNDLNRYIPILPHQRIPTDINKESVISYLQEYQKVNESSFLYWQNIENNEQTAIN